MGLSCDHHQTTRSLCHEESHHRHVHGSRLRWRFLRLRRRRPGRREARRRGRRPGQEGEEGCQEGHQEGRQEGPQEGSRRREGCRVIQP
ncbi:MAG: hypothetical protein CVU73_05925 [Deltaproteobacteria bacterium HGW-Deltaproteobacteria-8]|nr:MAG: hypothetical protein CVU73_05925 [Deltaproteobacteria bacterium HGW-Deltaproteobacteria-8]